MQKALSGVRRHYEELALWHVIQKRGFCMMVVPASLTEAILWNGGEAEGAKTRFTRYPPRKNKH